MFLLLITGIILIYLKGNESLSNDQTKQDEEQSVVIYNNDTEIFWEKEEFENETSNRREPSTASQKGGSETLEVILPNEDTETNDKQKNDTDVTWFPGVW